MTKRDVVWKRIHLAAGLGAIHFFWRVKRDTREPLIYAAVLALLLLVRVVAVVTGPATGRRRWFSPNRTAFCD